MFWLDALDEAFVGPAWHGPSLLGSLRGVRPAGALWRPGPGRHCIWDLVLHCAYWKYVVRRRITGEKRGSFDRKGSNFFPVPEPADARAWREDLALLRAEHARLRAVVAELPSAAFSNRAGKQWTIGETVRGAAFHDLYHAGQIQLIKRLQTARRTR